MKSPIILHALPEHQSRIGYLPPANTLTMMASTGQKIIIHLDSGEVDLCGLEPSEGARLFWEAVKRQFPKREAP